MPFGSFSKHSNSMGPPTIVDRSSAVDTGETRRRDGPQPRTLLGLIRLFMQDISSSPVEITGIGETSSENCPQPNPDVAKLLNDCLGVILSEDVGCVIALYFLLLTFLQVL